MESITLTMSPQDVGRELGGISYPSVLNLLNRSDFPAFRCGRKWIIPRDQFQEWLRQQATSKGGQ